MYYFYKKSNQGHGFCPLYRGCPPFGESVIRGFTVLHLLKEWSEIPQPQPRQQQKSHQSDSTLQWATCKHTHAAMISSSWYSVPHEVLLVEFWMIVTFVSKKLEPKI